MRFLRVLPRRRAFFILADVRSYSEDDMGSNRHHPKLLGSVRRTPIPHFYCECVVRSTCKFVSLAKSFSTLLRPSFTLHLTSNLFQTNRVIIPSIYSNIKRKRRFIGTCSFRNFF